MVSARDGFFDVTQQGVDPVEIRVLHAGTSIADDVAVVKVDRRVEGSKTPEPVADDLTARRNSLLSVATHLGNGKAAHKAQLNTLRMAILIGLHGGDKRKLVLSTAPALSWPFTAQVGVINLDAPREPLS